MDYIQKKIQKKIEEARLLGTNNQDLKTHFRVKTEYIFFMVLGYLWNKNFSSLPEKQKEILLKSIIAPPLGTIIKIIETLDVNNEVFKQGFFSDLLTKYNKLRIEFDGHGYTYDDEGAEEYMNEILQLDEELKTAKLFLLDKNIDLIKVQNEIDGNYVGKKFMPNGEDALWSCPLKQVDLKLSHLYGMYLNDDELIPRYFDLSPFVEIIDESEFYVFACVAQKLTGEIKYNRINKSGKNIIEWKDFAANYASTDEFIEKSINNTIVNKFVPNYKDHQFIEIGDNKKKILDFLTGKYSQSSVCANMWGHGGVGKTATIQHFIQDIKTVQPRYFNYIIFLSNKDRFYNIHKDKIEAISDDERIATYEELITNINGVVFGQKEAIFDEDRIINFEDGKILIIIDDFETYSSEDKSKINEFIKRLKPQFHKVIITTRATIRIGTDDIICNELNEKETIEFFLKVLQWKFPAKNISEVQIELNDTKMKSELRAITQGKPLRIWQFANIYEQIGDLDTSLQHFHKTRSSELDEFFYGRYYDYFTQDAKDVWDVMGQFSYDDDLINSFSRIKFALKWAEENEDRFNSAISELSRLRVIEQIDSQFYKIWDRDILKSMKITFQERKDATGFNKRRINDEISKINKSKFIDTEEALLYAARENKVLGKSEKEITDGFRRVLNRDTAPLNIKLRALIELTSYYRIYLGSVELAYKEFQNFERLFPNNPDFAKAYSLACYENNQFDKAVELLMKMLNSRDKGYQLSDVDRVELTGILLTRKRRMLLDERDKLKSEFGQLSKEELSKRNKDIFKQFDILVNKYGRGLFNDFKSTQFKDKSQRTNAETGLRHLVEICILTQKYDFANEVCDYAVKNFEKHFRDQFEQLSKRIPKSKFERPVIDKNVSSDLSENSVKVLNDIKSKLESKETRSVIFINAYTSKDIGKNLIGYVSHYSNGMGRIKDESGNYFFFHKNDFETPNAIKLETKVSFEIGSNMKGISAVKIMPIDS
jgi:hypothetical protein